MYALISVLIIIACILLSLVVLVQNSKGGGLAANFASSNQIMGVRRTTDFLEKATWTLAGALLVLSILATITIPRQSTEEKSKIEQQVESTLPVGKMPSFPTSAPAKPDQNQPSQNQSTGNQPDNQSK
jgi:preprotein translocase subunit SecG